MVDRAAAAFISAQPVLDFIMTSARLNDPRQALSATSIRAASRAIKGVKIELRLPGGKRRSYRAKGLTSTSVAASVFENDQLGRKESVASFFEREHKLRLQFPNLPCVDVSLSKAKPRWLPAELCHVLQGALAASRPLSARISLTCRSSLTGQRRLLVDTSDASAAMIKLCASKPWDRKRDIEQTMRNAVCGDPTLRAFGLQVSGDMTSVDGRVLNVPTIEYGGSKSARPALVLR